LTQKRASHQNGYKEKMEAFRWALAAMCLSIVTMSLFLAGVAVYATHGRLSLIALMALLITSLGWNQLVVKDRPGG
jgi:hypothetical protein